MASAARRRDLRTDESGADHNHLGARVEQLAQRERVVERSQGKESREIRLVREPARGRAGRDHQPVECDALPVVQFDLTRARVEGDRTRIETPVELEIVDALLAQHHLVGFPIAAKELLGKRRPVVRQVRFGTDRDDPAVDAARRARSRRSPRSA